MRSLKRAYHALQSIFLSHETNMMRKPIVILGLAVALLSACNQKEHTEQELPKLEVTNPLRKDAEITKEYVCQIHAFRHIELRSLEKGYLQNIYVDEGQTVKKGQPMFKIMPNIYEVDLQKARAEAEMVNIEYQNTKALAERNIVSKNELALAKAKLDKAHAEVRMAETHLGFTNVNAPFDGVMDHLNVRVGSLVDEGELLTTISDISKMWVYFNVPEAEYLDYKASKEMQSNVNVKLKMANGEVFEHAGVVETIEADFDNKTGNIEFRATFPNPERILRHGGTGNILMSVPYKNAMIIPQKATFEILDKSYVYVVDKDGKLQQKLIKIEAELPHLFIVDGLQDTDKVLLEGLRKVHNGQQIAVDFKSPEKVISELKFHAE